MTTHKALHSRDDVDRFYVSRKEKGRGIANIEDWVDVSLQGFKDYIKKSKKILITAASNSISNIRTKRTSTKTWKQKWEEKQLYEYFKWQTSELVHGKIWIWLRKGNLERKTEALPTEAQNNAMRTNNIKAKINNTQQNSKCR